MSPRILTGNSQGISIDPTKLERNVKYDYPNKLDMKPGSDLHQKVVSHIMSRGTDSSNYMHRKHDTWREIDRTLTAYIPLSEEEELLQDEDETKPVSLVVPVSYAILESMLTYQTSRWLSDQRIFRYTGHGPEDQYGAILLELAVMLQSIKGRHALSMRTWFRDAFAYGFGVATPQWTVKTGRKVEYQPRLEGTPFETLLPPRRMNVDTVLYEGHEIDNVNPYRYLPDPNTPVHKPQDAEYIGWVVRDNIMNLIRMEELGMLFNVQHLRSLIGNGPGSSNLYTEGDSEKEDRFGPEKSSTSDTRPVDVVWMYVDLIPEEWGIGKKPFPEKWLFAVAADSVVIQAKPMDLNHNKFPVAVVAPNYDGYTGMPPSSLEIIHPLQDSMNWLFNSHQANIRKGLNDMWLVDPSRINMNDLSDPRPGKMIRVRKASWGRDVRDAVMQFPINDVTSQNIRDMAVMNDILQRVTGVNENLQGQVASRGERVSADESRGARMAGIGRMEACAQIIRSQGIWELGDLLASQTQQFMEEETWVNVIGDWEQVLAEEYDVRDPRLLVRPQDIAIGYDVVPGDEGDMGGENMNEWVQMLQVISSNPETAQLFDIPRIVMHIGRLGGAKNVHQFRRRAQPQVMPDEEVLALADKGDIREASFA